MLAIWMAQHVGSIVSDEPPADRSVRQASIQQVHLTEMSGPPRRALIAVCACWCDADPTSVRAGDAVLACRAGPRTVSPARPVLAVGERPRERAWRMHDDWSGRALASAPRVWMAVCVGASPTGTGPTSGYPAGGTWATAVNISTARPRW